MSSRWFLPCSKRCSVSGGVGIRPLPVSWCARLSRHLRTKAHGSGSKSSWSRTHAGRAPHSTSSSAIVFRVEGDVGAMVAWCTGARPRARLGAGSKGIAAHPGGTAAVVILTIIHRRSDVHPKTSFGFLLDLVGGEGKWCWCNLCIRSTEKSTQCQWRLIGQTLPELVVQNTHGKNKQKGNERCKGNISEVVHFLVN